jgi:hypothetical protein
MSSNHPPTLAKWLLRHFGSSPNNEVAIGDLDERYRQGLSYLWYWKQAVGAIVVSFFNEVWGHKLLAVRALLIGWIIKVVWISAFKVSYGQPPWRLFNGGIEASVLIALIGVFTLMGTGWIISRTHRAHFRAMVLLFIAMELIGIPLAAFAHGTFGFYYWILPMTKITNAAMYHLGIVKPAAGRWTSAGIMVMSILIGAGFFRNMRDSGPQEIHFEIKRV